MRRPARLRGPARAAYFGLLAVVLHVVFAVLGMLLSYLLPTPKIEPEVEVTWIERPPENPAIKLPESTPPEPLMSPAPAVPPAPRPAMAQLTPPPPQLSQAAPKPPPPKPPELAILKPKPAEPPKPTPIPKPPEEEKKPEPPPPPQPQQQPQHMKKVEVDNDQDVVNEPPPEAAYLSDKNRRVKEETRDTKTNLDKVSKGKADASEKSKDTESEDIGGEDQKVRQLEKAEASTLEKKNLDPTVHNGKAQESKDLLSGTKGQTATGDNGKNGEGGKPGALAMRNVEGRGAPGQAPSMSVAPAGANDDAPAVAMSENPGLKGDSGPTGKEGKAGKAGKRGPKLDLAMDDYKRIIGEEAYREEAEIASRQKSHKKGRWEQKQERLHAALENFTPEVKPGNQTALGTRAAPFAVFIARMHRRIHELWGFGFLEDLDGKSPSNPMNNRQLEVKLEIVLNSDGTVDRATIVRTSGVLTFDVAAIDTIENAGPFEEPPQEIRSTNGKIYLHWTFHRDERQCSPYFADPFILDNPPADGNERGLPNPADAVAQRHRKAEQLKRNASPTEGGVQVPHMARTADEEAAAARATVNTPTADDPAAEGAALKWLDAFEAGRLDSLVAMSQVPFKSGGQVVAQDAGALARVWRTILDESPSRTIKKWKVLSPAGYRAVFGRLPKGGEDGANQLYLAARVGSDWLTLDIVQVGEGSYQVRGFSR